MSNVGTKGSMPDPTLVYFQAMCIEKESVLHLPSNPLFTPVPVIDGRFPLKDCVLSVSQFMGSERESLVELATYLGATYDCLATYTNTFIYKDSTIETTVLLVFSLH